ncbi:MAG: electron transport complex subunit RsxC [Candidatus Lokiarchaeota archaeon]|nr:electron transport complex subunit RsxC [Candidatus Lokiarchaeota archaeon]
MLFNKKNEYKFIEKGRFNVDIDIKMNALEDPFSIVPPAEEMIVFLKQHIGPGTDLVVNVGDSVRYGQKIGDNPDAGLMVAPIHSPVNGKIKEEIEMLNPISGNIEKAVKIATTDNNSEPFFKPLDPEKESKNTLLERVRETGIVGLGGASFPTHVKLNTSHKISHLIINAKESDPNIACDCRLMMEKPQEIINGIKIMAKILDVKAITVATRTQEGETPEFEALLKEHEIELKRMRPNYSIGSEKLLVKEVLDKEVPSGKFPPDIGVLVHNIATAYAVEEAIEKGEPLVSRGLTYYSKEKGGKNLWVRMGTPVEHILKFVGDSPSQYERIILGSILMGPTIPNPSYPILKATSAVTVFTQDEPDPYKKPLACIRCGYCNTVCPVYIYPQLIMEAEKKKDVDRLKKLHVEDCIECGLCSYVCPSRIRFTKYLTNGKKLVRNE